MGASVHVLVVASLAAKRPVYKRTAVHQGTAQARKQTGAWHKGAPSSAESGLLNRLRGRLPQGATVE